MILEIEVPENAPASILATPFGIFILFNKVELANVDSSIDLSLLELEKTTVCNSDTEKAHSPTIETDAGIVMPVMPDWKKVKPPIDRSLLPSANVIFFNFAVF